MVREKGTVLLWLILDRLFWTAKSLRISEVSRLKTAKAMDKFLDVAILSVPKEDLAVQCYPSQCGHRSVMLLGWQMLWKITNGPYIMVIMKISLTDLPNFPDRKKKLAHRDARTPLLRLKMKQGNELNFHSFSQSIRNIFYIWNWNSIDGSQKRSIRSPS